MGQGTEATLQDLQDNMKAVYDYINRIVGELKDQHVRLQRQVDENEKSLKIAHRRIDDLRQMFDYHRQGGYDYDG